MVKRSLRTRSESSRIRRTEIRLLTSTIIHLRCALSLPPLQTHINYVPIELEVLREYYRAVAQWPDSRPAAEGAASNHSNSNDSSTTTSATRSAAGPAGTRAVTGAISATEHEPRAAYPR